MPVVPILFALLSFLILVRAPAFPLWILSIPVFEWGWLLSLIFIFCLWRWDPSFQHKRIWWVSLPTVLIFWIPVLFAYRASHRIPQQLVSAFPIRQELKQKPFSWKGIFSIHSTFPTVRKTESYPLANGEKMPIDVYLSPSKEKKPILVVVHGGSWRSGDRTELSSWNPIYASWGYVVVAPDYRLAPQARFPSQVQDVAASIAYAKQKADEWQADPTTIVLLGRSAGAQIALMAAYTLKDPSIRGVVDLYGPANMVFAYSKPGNPLVLNSREVLREYMGGPPESIVGGYESASPVHQVNAQAVPTLMIHGLKDPMVWVNHAYFLEGQLRAFQRPSYFLKLPYATHGSDVFPMGPNGQLIAYATRHFLQWIQEERSKRRVP